MSKCNEQTLGHEWVMDKLSPNYFTCLYCNKQVRELPKGDKDGDT